MPAWNQRPEDAVRVQEELRTAVIRRDEIGPVRLVAGVDAAFEPDGSGVVAAAALLHFPSMDICCNATWREDAVFPYVPGLLSFREAPAALLALGRLPRAPDLLLCDGHGLAHPRRFGLACHIGVISGIPSIGVAKTPFVGMHDVLAAERGAWVPLMDAGDVIGAVVRTRTGVKPVYVSVGHRISLETAIAYVLRCAPRYRLPEPARWAHRLANREITVAGNQLPPAEREV